MKFHIENLGKIKTAELQLWRLTVLTGENNSGKSYVTCALFGFLYFWNTFSKLQDWKLPLDKLFRDGTMEIAADTVLSQQRKIFDLFAKNYERELPTLLAANQKNLNDCRFRCDVDRSEIAPIEESSEVFGSADNQLFEIHADKKKQSFKIELIGTQVALANMPRNLIEDFIKNNLRRHSFGNIFPSPLISSSERTGIATFRKHLDFFRDQLMEKIADGTKTLDPEQFLIEIKRRFPITIECNVEFSRSLEEKSRQESFLVKEDPGLLIDFNEIVGGTYQVRDDDRLFFKPHKATRMLTMRESSSSVRSLLDLHFYLHHVLQRHHILIIDEPELSLHPKNQRAMAKIIARLVNLGVHVFVTTHSDYIIRELNNLILLGNEEYNNSDILTRYGYKKTETLNSDKIRIYSAEINKVKPAGYKRKIVKPTLVEIPVSQRTGMEIQSFDIQINEMNSLQDELIWGV